MSSEVRWAGRRPYPLFLLLLAAFAAGALADRAGLIPTLSWRQPPGTAQTFAPFWEAWKVVHEEYVERKDLDDKVLAEGAIRGMVNALGDEGHTTYLTPEEWQNMQSSLQGELEGIGATIGLRKRRLTIMNTLPDSPARKAGLRAGDVLLKVDGKDVADLSLEQIVQDVRGPANTKVRLTIQRKGASAPLDFTLTRARVTIPAVTWHLLPGAPLAHIALHEFSDQADGHLKEALAQARKQGAKGLIVDVRNNPGGLAEQAVAVTSEFLKPPDIVFIEQDAHGHRKDILVSSKGGAAGDLPVVVLIDEGTASSAEIFAGALQDYGRARLVGTRTYGTGTVLQDFPLIDGSALLLAVDEWLTPKGRRIWHEGITPDVVVEMPADAPLLEPGEEADLTAAGLAHTEDKQLLKAYEMLCKEIADGQGKKNPQ
jgi:carboxyl-terminal processing protease